MTTEEFEQETSQQIPVLLLDDDDDGQSNDSRIMPSLSRPLIILFACNGLTLALPMTALLYIVNDRVEMPLSLLPSYAAAAFLPSCLKPAYAWLSTSGSSLISVMSRDIQIALLLSLSALSYAATVFIPKHSVVVCFVLAFLRTFFSEWPEFLLGLTLIDEAVTVGQAGDDESYYYETTAALFQSEAATARNVGSLIAQILSVLFFVVVKLVRAKSPAATDNVLNDTIVGVFLFAAAVLNLVGAIIAWTCRVGVVAVNDDSNSVNSINNEELPLTNNPSNDISSSKDSDPLRISTLELEAPETEPLLPAEEDNNSTLPISNNNNSTNVWLIVLLQISAILITMRQPVAHVVSSIGWDLMASTSILALVAATCSSFSVAGFRHWQRQHRVGLYLILRYAVPSVSYLMSSFFYTIFEKSPAFLQLLMLFDMGILTAASWSYGKLFSKYSQNDKLLWLIAGTTTLAAAASFGNVALIKVLDPVTSQFSWIAKISLTLVVKAIIGFTSEWKFLPDFVLATVSVDARLNRSTRHAQVQDSLFSDEPLNEETEQERTTRVSLQYGTLVSCIDYGDQLGAVLAVPLVALVGTSRDNNWAHLDWLQEINSTLMLCSIVLLVLLR